jgi:hypothetical protein
MKNHHFLTLLCALVITPCMGQGVSFPFNPDSNNDGLVGATDLMTFLSAYGSNWGLMEGVELPSYEFPDFEQSVYDIWSNNAIVDSIYFTYSFTVVHDWYPAGSPELQTDTITYDREITLIPWSGSVPFGQMQYRGIVADGGSVKIYLAHGGSDSGEYSIALTDETNTMYYLTSIGVVSDRFIASSSWHITEGVPENNWSMDSSSWLWTPMVYQSSNGVVLSHFQLSPYFSSAE